MNARSFSLVAALGLLAGVAACSSPNPNQPSVSFVAPVAQTPSNGTAFNFNQQPITLAITNAQKTGGATVTYSVQVATDTAFANKAFTQDNIPEGANGVTTVQVSGLNGNTTFYWHSEAVIDSVTGQPSATQTFFVRPNIVIQAPTLASPTSGGSASGARPTFIVNDSTRTGPAGTIFYVFQVATDSGFKSIVANATIQEQANQTAFTPSSDLPGGPLFWRVQATDPANSITSSFGTGSFTLVPFDMTQATILDNPPDLGSWAQTSNILSIVFTPISFEVDFDKRDGPDRWPDVGFGDGALEYTLGMCVNPNQAGHWYCSAVVQFWFGRDLDASGVPDQIGVSWFYDNRWAPIIGYQPQNGETVGVFTAAGNLRDSGNVITKERTNVEMIPWETNYFLSTSAKRVTSVRR